MNIVVVLGGEVRWLLSDDASKLERAFASFYLGRRVSVRAQLHPSAFAKCNAGRRGANGSRLRFGFVGTAAHSERAFGDESRRLIF
jgi:hypothetical protein